MNNRYRVWMQTKPGVGVEFYSGKVDVWASSPTDAESKAIRQADTVHRRGWGGYVVTKIEVLAQLPQQEVTGE